MHEIYVVISLYLQNKICYWVVEIILFSMEISSFSALNKIWNLYLVRSIASDILLDDSKFYTKLSGNTLSSDLNKTLHFDAIRIFFTIMNFTDYNGYDTIVGVITTNLSPFLSKCYIPNKTVLGLYLLQQHN